MGLTLLEIQALTASLAANGRVPSTVPAPPASSTVTGIIPAAGAAATAGSGFTYTHTNGTGVYVFTFATPFAAAPDIQTTINQTGITSPTAVVTPFSAAGFTVTTQSVGTPSDLAFSFTAQAVT